MVILSKNSRGITWCQFISIKVRLTLTGPRSKLEVGDLFETVHSIDASTRHTDLTKRIKNM